MVEQKLTPPVLASQSAFPGSTTPRSHSDDVKRFFIPTKKLRRHRDPVQSDVSLPSSSVSSVPPLLELFARALRAYRLNEHFRPQASHCHSPSTWTPKLQLRASFAVDSNIPSTPLFRPTVAIPSFSMHFLGIDSWLRICVKRSTRRHHNNTDSREW